MRWAAAHLNSAHYDQLQFATAVSSPDACNPACASPRALQVALHEGRIGDISSPHMCEQMRSGVVLREPMERMASHISNTAKVLEKE